MTMTAAHQTTSTAIVIGAGVAGLATAGLLAREGHRVTVIERTGSVGGRAGDLQLPEAPGFRWDTGPSWYLMPDAFDHFFALMGTSTEQELELVDLQPAYRIFSEEETPLDVPSGAEAAGELFESIEPGAGQRLQTYLNKASDAYDMALNRFLYTTFSSLPELLHPSIRSRALRLVKLLTTSLQDLVREDFSDPRLQQILSYPAVFLSSRPESTPALYHLMSHTDLVQGVRYPVGGFTAVIQAMHRLCLDHGVNFELDTQVLAINTEALPSRTGNALRRRTPRARATGVTVRRSEAGISEIPADLVVSGADLHHTETNLLPSLLRTYPERRWANRNPGIGTVLVMLGVRGALPELSHHNLLFSRDWDPDFRAVFDGVEPDRPLSASQSIYVSKSSASDPTAAPAGDENLFVLIPVPANPAIGHGDAYATTASPLVDDIADAAIAQLSRWAGISDLSDRILVRRTLGPADFSSRYNAWRGGAIGPAHTLGQSAFFRGKNISDKVDNLYYAGATTVPGVGVPMCLISAENVIKRLRGDTTAAPLTEPLRDNRERHA